MNGIVELKDKQQVQLLMNCCAVTESIHATTISRMEIVIDHRGTLNDM